MSTTQQRYARLADDFARTIVDVPDDRWEDDSPCPGWTARDVLDHVIEAHEIFLGRVDGVPTDRPSTSEDPRGAFEAVRAAVEKALADPAVAGTTWSSEVGEHRFEDAIDQYQCLDLLVHRWDLARGAGLDVSLPVEELRRVRDQVSAWPEAMVRSTDVFGPEVEVPADADEQVRILAFLGRDATDAGTA